MPENSFVPLPGSDRQPVTGAQPGRDLDDATPIEVTLVTRRREALPAEVVTGPATISRDELAARHGTDPSDLALIRDVLGRFGLTVTGADAGARRVTVTARFPASRRPSARPCARSAHRTRRPRGAWHSTATGWAACTCPPSWTAWCSPCSAWTTAPRPRRRSGGPRHRSRGSGDGRPDLLHARPGRAGLRLPGGHRRDRADHRHHRAWRRIRREGPRQLLLQPGHHRPDGDRGRGGRRIERGRAGSAGRRRGGAAGHRGRRSGGAGRQPSSTSRRTATRIRRAVTTAVHASPTPTVMSISWGQSEDSWTGQARTALDQAFADAAALGVTVTGPRVTTAVATGCPTGRPTSTSPRPARTRSPAVAPACG